MKALNFDWTSSEQRFCSRPREDPDWSAGFDLDLQTAIGGARVTSVRRHEATYSTTNLPSVEEGLGCWGWMTVRGPLGIESLTHAFECSHGTGLRLLEKLYDRSHQTECHISIGDTGPCMLEPCLLYSNREFSSTLRAASGVLTPRTLSHAIVFVQQRSEDGVGIRRRCALARNRLYGCHSGYG